MNLRGSTGMTLVLLCGKSLLFRHQVYALTVLPKKGASKSLPLSSSSSYGNSFLTRRFSSTRDRTDTGNADTGNDRTTAPSTNSTPWNDPRMEERVKVRRGNNKSRFRQHVNPLARQYQQPTELSDNWPKDTFDIIKGRSLHIDIGCGKGGFLLEYAASEYAAQESCNYIGLEIRPMVAQFARDRIPLRNLAGKVDFLGCNVNVDLERLLMRYHDAAADTEDHRPLLLSRVSIQYPDPHFKKSHAKRRVVVPDLVDTIAKFMAPGTGTVFLQSDIQPVLDDMRDRFQEASRYFELDAKHQAHEYLPENPLGVPTEREISVLDKSLPVYRVLFRRTEALYEPNSIAAGSAGCPSTTIDEANEA